MNNGFVWHSNFSSKFRLKIAMKLTKLFILLTVFISLFSIPAYAQTTVSDVEIPEDLHLIIKGVFPERRITGKVVGVHDGDTATVLDASKTQYKFRFNGIDAPELKQDFGNKSKQNLSDLIFGKEVTVIYNKVDKYGRFVGKIMVNGIDANLEQIKAGLAWHYKKYADEQSEADRKAYSDAEAEAKNARKGFWVLPNPTPPWDHRAEIKTKQEAEKANRKYLVGAKGGCYYLNSSGNKSYVDKKFCANIPTVVKSETKPEKSADEETKKSDGRTYIKGSRGGCYYLNASGKKIYVSDKSLCGGQ